MLRGRDWPWIDAYLRRHLGGEHRHKYPKGGVPLSHVLEAWNAAGRQPETTIEELRAIVLQHRYYLRPGTDNVIGVPGTF
jgi:hypothetical protein